MARPKKTTEESNNETQTIDYEKEILRLKQEKEQLEHKLQKRNAPINIPTAQHRVDQNTLEEMRQEDNQKIKGVFRCFQPPGGNVSFYFRQYKKDPIEKYELFDGKEYELPKNVVRHLNENCYEEDKAFLLDANGEKIKGAGKRHYRFAFTQKV